MGKEETMIADLWTQLTGRKRVVKFHLANTPMMHLAWNQLDDRQKGIILNVGSIFGLDAPRRPDPSSFT